MISKGHPNIGEPKERLIVAEVKVLGWNKFHFLALVQHFDDLLTKLTSH